MFIFLAKNLKRLYPTLQSPFKAQNVYTMVNLMIETSKNFPMDLLFGQYSIGFSQVKNVFSEKYPFRWAYWNINVTFNQWTIMLATELLCNNLSENCYVRHDDYNGTVHDMQWNFCSINPLKWDIDIAPKYLKRPVFPWDTWAFDTTS